MAQLQLQHLRKAFGPHEILHGIDLDIADGEFVVFVGPSGCGKSTLLRCIAGLEDITSGHLWIGDQEVNELPPSKRQISMVFQSYALYPHMNVAKNMAFGLHLAGLSASEIDSAVSRAAQILQIEHLLKRYPKDLSGGQRQRVAIGRAIVRKPEVFLFDEPLSNLDAALRVQMRVELARLHRELRTTMIYVTHDQVEAMTLANRIVVFNAGRVEQVGTPMALYQQPVNRFVAGFIGSPNMNFLAATVLSASASGAKVQLRCGTPIEVDVQADRLSAGDTVTLGIRPEHLSAHAHALHNRFPAVIQATEHLGDVSYLYASGADQTHLVVRSDPEAPMLTDDKVYLHVPPQRAHLFDTHGQALRRLI